MMQIHHRRRLVPLIAAAIATVHSEHASAQEAPPAPEPFPVSTPLEEGVSPDAIEALDELVRSLVDEGEIVGGELLVLKHDRVVLHEAYGLADREEGTPMQTNSVFCVRSMTKPLIGASVLMLVDERKLKLSDRVSKYLPAFDVEGMSEITVEHLLTHTSGLPMSLIMDRNPRELVELGGIGGVAALVDASVLDTAPGEAFHYSDQGTDTLTALVEAVTDAPAADFVRERLLEPLGMRDSTCVMSVDSPLRERALPAYAGSSGEWTRFWGPDEEPLFPFFLGSQGLYSTVTDYARFLALWRDRGRVGGERLLKAGSVRKALTPATDSKIGSTGFPDLATRYGMLMQLWIEPAEALGEERRRDELVAFGHTGSDGTLAYVFPEEDAMALFFTQSRGNQGLMRVEEALARVFLGAPFDPNELAPPIEDYLGFYFEGGDDFYRAIVREGDDMVLDIQGRAAVPMTFAGGDRWKLRPEPTTVLEFQRDEYGVVTGYRIGEHEEFRFTPSPDLPTVAELAERVAQTHRIDLLETLGPIRMQGTIEMERLGRSGTVDTVLAWPDRFRMDARMGEEFENVAFDGETVRYESPQEELGPLEGAKADNARVGTSLARLGDWERWYGEMQVVQRIERPDEDGDGEVEVVYAVRAGGLVGPGRTLVVHESGRVVHEFSLAELAGVGRLGQQVHFADFRDVSGMLLPHRIAIEMAHPLIGTIETTIESVELGIEVAEGVFRLEE